MQEGHHVTGMHDLVGTDSQDKIRSDCWYLSDIETISDVT